MDMLTDTQIRQITLGTALQPVYYIAQWGDVEAPISGDELAMIKAGKHLAVPRGVC